MRSFLGFMLHVYSVHFVTAACERGALQPRPMLTTYSPHMLGWYVVSDRHDPTVGGMKGFGGDVGPLGPACAKPL